MAGLRERVEQVAALARVKPVTAINSARTLGEAEPPLFVRPGRGVREAIFQTSHLVHLAAAILLGQPAQAAKTVMQLGGMSRNVPQSTNLAETAWFKLLEQNRGTSPTDDLCVGDMILSPNALDFITGYVDRLRGAERDTLLPFVEDFSVQFRYFSSLDAGISDGGSAMFSFRGPDESIISWLYVMPSDWPISDELLDKSVEEGKAHPIHSTEIPGHFFLALADLLRADDAGRASALPLSLSGSGVASSEPENENAALPGAALRDQHRTTDDTEGLTSSYGSRTARNVQARHTLVMRTGRVSPPTRTSHVQQIAHTSS